MTTNNNSCNSKFQDMDLGTAKPISVPMELVEIQISSADLVADYAKAFVSEAYRVNPRKAEQVKLTAEELLAYADFLLTQRVDCVKGVCKDFRRLKVLYIPSYLQYVLSMIGEFIDREMGLKFVPVMAKRSELTLKQAIAISEKVGSFIDDLQVVQDAMPRDPKGDKDVMSTALIAGYVRAYVKVDHPAATYVTAFLNMQLKKEAAFKALYRIQYDDYDFISMALTSQKGLY